jgi:hypothetical protein
MILHRRVKCPHPGGGNSERYYIETSSRIPVDSSDTPTVAIFLSILLTIFKVLPDPPALPLEDAPTPYTVDSPTNEAQGRFLVTPHCLSAGQHPVHVHFDIPGFASDTIFATEPFVTPASPPSDIREEAYEEWLKGIRKEWTSPTNTGQLSALAPEEYSTIADSRDTVHLTKVRSGSDPEMMFAGNLGDKPIEAWYSSPKMAHLSLHLARQALLFKSNLAELQGKIVPRFYGLYLAEHWSLLVIEDCGQMVYPLETLPENEKCVWTRTIFSSSFFLKQFARYCRIALYSGFYEIHKAGVMMPDLCYNATRNARGKFRIGEFSEAEPGHICPGHEKCEMLEFVRHYRFALSKHPGFC